MGKFREIVLKSGTKIFLGKNAENNDVLVSQFKGKGNTILHTSAPGSPFGVIENLETGSKEIGEAGVIVAKYSQDWRNNKKDIVVDVFTGKDVSKPWFSKTGTWKVRKSKKIKIKKEDILMFERKNKKK
ncbi:MAG: hypothetical protein KJ879_00155 [Nanoarchaeota archaeon]|nr:hypothetical protein [Nanoarchaeota archaeon]